MPELLYGFVRQSREFVLGVEAGRFWEEAQTVPNGEELIGLFHQSNEAELLRMGDTAGLKRVNWESLDENFAHGIWRRP